MATGLQPSLSANRGWRSVIQAILFLCGAISILTTLGIIYELGKVMAVSAVGVDLVEFFTGTTWQPQILQFGIWPW